MHCGYPYIPLQYGLPPPYPPVPPAPPVIIIRKSAPASGRKFTKKKKVKRRDPWNFWKPPMAPMFQNPHYGFFSDHLPGGPLAISSPPRAKRKREDEVPDTVEKAPRIGMDYDDIL